MNARHIPNLISLLRIALVVPLWWLLGEGRYWETLALFAIAGASDGIDGFLARHYHWQSRLGAFLDPIGDKLMMLTAYLWLGWLGALPWWLVAMVLCRDLIIILGVVAYHRLIERIELAPTLISKANTTVQILLGLLALLGLAGVALPEALLPVGIAVVAITTLWSGLDYVLRWAVRARRIHREKKQ